MDPNEAAKALLKGSLAFTTYAQERLAACNEGDVIAPVVACSAAIAGAAAFGAFASIYAVLLRGDNK